MKKLIFIILTVLLAFAFVSCGKTTVEISEDGYWVIDGVKTEVLAKGEKGDKGDTGSQGEKGDKGDKGDTGEQGVAAPAPTVEISEDGYWVINGVKTEVLAAGEKGDKGDSASDENPQGLDFFLKDDGTYAVGLGNSIYLPEVEIPSTYNGKPVTEITFSATLLILEEIDGACKIEKIVIPDSVTKIGDFAFYYCDSLTSFVIPDSVTSIGNYAFDYCRSLTSVVIGNSVTSIGDYAFEYCSRLVEVINKSELDITTTSFGLNAIEVHNGETKVKNINGYLFYTLAETNYLFGYVGSDTALTLPENYNGGNYAIYDRAFQYCHNITSITIPDSVTSIGDYAFHYCESLTSVEIPDSVTSIGHAVFALCTKLTNAIIGDSVKSISSNAFERCTKLVSITIGNSVESIGSNSFSYCDHLVEVINKSSLNIIAGSSTYSGVAAYAVEVHNGETKVKNINAYIFYPLNEKNYLVDYIGNDTHLTLPENYNGENYAIYDRAFQYYYNITSITIPDSVTSISIGDYAFHYCESLTSVVIGDSVTSIGKNAFYNCTSLTSVVIGDSVTSISDCAFYGCNSLTSIVIPDSVTSIGYAVFELCTSLTSVAIPDSVTSIGNHAFFYCESLTSIVIPDSVTSIGNYAFSSCTSLADVFYTGTEAQWAEILMSSGNNDLTNATIHYNYTAQ